MHGTVLDGSFWLVTWIKYVFPKPRILAFLFFKRHQSKTFESCIEASTPSTTILLPTSSMPWYIIQQCFSKKSSLCTFDKTALPPALCYVRNVYTLRITDYASKQNLLILAIILGLIRMLRKRVLNEEEQSKSVFTSRAKSITAIFGTPRSLHYVLPWWTLYHYLVSLSRFPPIHIVQAFYS